MAERSNARSIARECLPFLDAIAAATDTPPAVEVIEAAVAAANQDARPS